MSQTVWGNDTSQYFYHLTPEQILNAADALKLNPTGRVLTMGSMENRVYEVEIDVDESKLRSESERFRILKFYRPGRWTKEQIQEEHNFLLDLEEHEIPVIAPIVFDGKTLFENEDKLLYTCFPKQGGRAADEWTTPLLQQMGRLLARLHNVGASKEATHRLRLDLKSYGQNNLDYLVLQDKILPQYKERYKKIASEIFEASAPCFEGIKFQRVHGDCHHGNTLLSSNGPYMIDFDDMVIAPRVQDIWMVTPGRDEYSLAQRNILLDAYDEMSEFDYRELKLIEPLRALRMIHFSSWIAHRFEDEAFKRAFSHFGSENYWQQEIQGLEEILGLIKAQSAMNNYY